jgi:hypothetical protein
MTQRNLEFHIGHRTPGLPLSPHYAAVTMDIHSPVFCLPRQPEFGGCLSGQTEDKP